MRHGNRPGPNWSILIQYVNNKRIVHISVVKRLRYQVGTRVEPDTRLKRVSGTDKALLPSTSIIRVIRVNICARIE